MDTEYPAHYAAHAYAMETLACDLHAVPVTQRLPSCFVAWIIDTVYQAPSGAKAAAAAYQGRTR